MKRIEYNTWFFMTILNLYVLNKSVKFGLAVNLTHLFISGIEMLFGNFNRHQVT